MSFDLENLNPPTRFYWGDSEEEWVDLRLASDDDTETLRKKAGIKRKIEYRRDRGQLHRIDYVDTSEKQLESFMALVNDFAIVDWCLLTKSGEKISCTFENKTKMMGGSPTFSEWVASRLEKLRSDVRAQEDKEQKNSLSTLTD